jgi:small multidrug resistance pump
MTATVAVTVIVVVDAGRIVAPVPARHSRQPAAQWRRLSCAARTVSYLYLAIAILAEVIGTSALKASDGFTRPLPSLIVAVGYAVSFYFLALALRAIPVGVAYAIWSGVGIALITLIGWIVFKQRLDAPALAGIALIVAGVVVIQMSSRAAAGVS